MTTSLLALGLAVITVFSIITLSDYSRLVNHQELAFTAAQDLATRLTAQCGNNDCDLPRGAQACAFGETVLQVIVSVPWKPQMWKALTPAVGRYLVSLELVGESLLADLYPCPASVKTHPGHPTLGVRITIDSANTAVKTRRSL